LDALKPIAKRLVPPPAVVLTRPQQYWKQVRAHVTKKMEKKHLSRFQAAVEAGLHWALTSQRFDFVRLFLPLVDVVGFCYRGNAAGMEQLLQPQFNRSCKRWMEDLYITTCRHVQDSVPEFQLKGERDAVNSFTLLDREGETIGHRIRQSIELAGGLKHNILLQAPHPAAIPKFPLLTIIIRRFVLQESKIHGASPGKEFVPLSPSSSLGPKQARISAYHDLMCWAIITGHFGMAEHFWQEGGNSIGNALFASALYDGLSQSALLQKTNAYRELRDHFAECAIKFEALAVGVLTECEEDNSMKTRSMLRLSLRNFRIMRHLKPTFTFDPISLAVDTNKL
jgi:hypothetical protein